MMRKCKHWNIRKGECMLKRKTYCDICSDYCPGEEA